MEKLRHNYEKKRNFKSQSKSSEEAKELMEAKKSLWGNYKCGNTLNEYQCNCGISNENQPLKILECKFITHENKAFLCNDYNNKNDGSNVHLRSFEESKGSWEEENKEIITNPSNYEEKNEDKIPQSNEDFSLQSSKTQSISEEFIQISDNFEEFMKQALKELDADFSKERRK